MAVFSEKTPGPANTREGVPGLSIIGAGMRVVGDISADGVVKIEGSVAGTVVDDPLRIDAHLEERVDDALRDGVMAAAGAQRRLAAFVDDGLEPDTI